MYGSQKDIAITRTKKGMSLRCLKFAYSIVAEIEYNSYQNLYFAKKLFYETIDSNFENENEKTAFIRFFELLGYYVDYENEGYLVIHIG